MKTLQIVPVICISVMLLSACDNQQSATEAPGLTGPVQVEISTRTVPLIESDGLQFRDLNKNNELDQYEDWRLPTENRVNDLVGRMSPEEKAGMLLIQSLNADVGGELPEKASRLVTEEHMTRFIFRNQVVIEPDPDAKAGFSGAQITAKQAAEYTNAVQELAESTRLGIPALFKSNARNHYEKDARAGISLATGSFSTWPKESGLAATRDMELIAEFADVMRQEWTAIGLRGMYGYMADLSTEPRWYRVHETFTEDADLAADIISTLVTGLQGKPLNSEGVALTIKHFPGGGPQKNGGDPHYFFGREQAYQSDNFDYHLKPFEAAVEAGASSIMAYYGVPVDQQIEPNDVGMAFSRGILTDLLRDQLDFQGYVNSDTGIIGEPGSNRAWGLEEATVEELLTTAIDAGTDVFSGFESHQQILGLVEKGAVNQARVDLSVGRLLREQFELGLFENPFVDAEVAGALVGNPGFQAKADLAQRKSIVLLQNNNQLLPLELPGQSESIEIYTLGMDADTVASYGYQVTAGDAETDGALAPVPENTDYALIRVTVSNPVQSLEQYPNEPNPFPGAKPSTMFGGALPDELDFLAFSDMEKAVSWNITPSLDEIQTVISEVGADNTVISIYFRQPFVVDDNSGLLDAGGMIALFGADDSALMDVLTGGFQPSGKLPFALANSPEAILRQASDAPGYAEEDVLFPFGYGLGYQN